MLYLKTNTFYCEDIKNEIPFVFKNRSQFLNEISLVIPLYHRPQYTLTNMLKINSNHWTSEINGSHYHN
jgi:hypothetical protein